MKAMDTGTGLEDVGTEAVEDHMDKDEAIYEAVDVEVDVEVEVMVDVVDVVDVAMGVVMGAVTEVERGTDGHTVPMALGITMVMPMPIMDTTAIVVATTTRANEGGTQRLVGSGTMGGPLFPYRLNDYLNRSE